MLFDDEDLPVNVDVIANGGIKLADIPNRLGQCSVDSKDVYVVTVHIGTCEWNANTPVPTIEKLGQPKKLTRQPQALEGGAWSTLNLQ